MDSVKSLPVNKDNREMSNDEKYIMDKYFDEENSKDELGDSGVLMKVFYLCIIYILVSNPFSEKLCSIVPYVGDSKIMNLLLRLMIFGVLSSIVLFYM